MSVFKKLLFTALIFFAAPVMAGGFNLLPDSVATQKEDNWLAPDKALHVTGSMIIMAAAGVNLRRRAGYSKQKALRFGFGFTFALGTAKEFYDAAKANNYFSYKDLSADIIGACVGAFLVSWD